MNNTIRTGIMRTYDEATRMRQNYLAARNRAIADVAMDMASGVQAGELVSVNAIAARAGVSTRVINAICRKYRYLPIVRVRGTDNYALSVEGNPGGEYEYVCSLGIRYGHDTTEVTYAAIGENGQPDFNNTIKKTRSTPKYGFYRQ